MKNERMSDSTAMETRSSDAGCDVWAEARGAIATVRANAMAMTLRVDTRIMRQPLQTGAAQVSLFCFQLTLALEAAKIPRHRGSLPVWGDLSGERDNGLANFMKLPNF